MYLKKINYHIFQHIYVFVKKKCDYFDNYRNIPMARMAYIFNGNNYCTILSVYVFGKVIF